MEQEIKKGYKATDKNMQCQGFQYAVGGEYYHPGALNLCPNDSDLKQGKGGFHFCENPLDVLDYYNLCDSEFHTVEAAGEIENDGKKSVTKNLKITATIGLPVFIKASIEYIRKTCLEEKPKEEASGDSAQLAASGYSAQLAASGDSAQLAASGDYAKLAASGDSAQLAASGYYAKLAASGDSAQLAASGYSAQLAAFGDDSIVAGIGIKNQAKGKTGTWIILAEWKLDENKGRYIPVCVKSAKIDGKRIKADTYYRLEGKKFVEYK